jgi:hypothetical protein
VGRIAEVLSTERTTGAGVHALDVKCDPGGGANVTAQLFAASGDDAPPLPGDYVALEDSAGAGRQQVSGCSDVRNAGTAAPGEKRIFARDADGNIVCEIHLKNGGSISIENAEGSLVLQDDGTVIVGDGAEFVALATKVLTELTALKAAILGWTPVPNDGGAALKTALTLLFTGPPVWPGSVASEVLKSD